MAYVEKADVSFTAMHTTYSVYSNRLVPTFSELVFKNFAECYPEPKGGVWHPGFWFDVHMVRR